MTELVLERKNQEPGGVLGGGLVMMTPNVTPDYWSYRVRLTETQAVVGFPKFGMIGIAYAQEEEDWNRNLPASCSTEEIAAWIAPNKGDVSIDNIAVLAAIKMIQDAVKADA